VVFDEKFRDCLTVLLCFIHTVHPSSCASELALAKHGVRVPALSDLQKELPLDETSVNQMLRTAAKEGRAVQLGPRRFALLETIKELALSVNELALEKPEFSVVDFRNYSGLGRNLTIELLEYFDSIRFTIRRGDNRTVVNSGLPASVANGSK
jgi:selenocysteine-specific elongation factor